ncbi:hypothetical protein R1sor_020531 [Riccia sorocarpa]|uniref:Uncharacterized protein n=1 Tax=Riccia sorocarpa TaxID=122646 RepID=A0ABD3IIZ4_9MARC
MDRRWWVITSKELNSAISFVTGKTTLEDIQKESISHLFGEIGEVYKFRQDLDNKDEYAQVESSDDNANKNTNVYDKEDIPPDHNIQLVLRLGGDIFIKMFSMGKKSVFGGCDIKTKIQDKEGILPDLVFARGTLTHYNNQEESTPHLLLNSSSSRLLATKILEFT